MKTLVIGASGATGKLLVNLLLESGKKVKIITRNESKISENWVCNSNLTIIKSNISNICPEEMVSYLSDCDSVISCLGHNLSWKGIYGKPRQLVTDAIKLIFEAKKISSKSEPLKLILMNTAGYRNKNLSESISIGERVIIFLLKMLLPPHLDNENAGDFLRKNVVQNNGLLEWVIVRPDNLIDENKVSNYTVLMSPSRSAIFKAGKTSRINVAHFMVNLNNENKLWNKWKWNMPVIYNDEN